MQTMARLLRDQGYAATGRAEPTGRERRVQRVAVPRLSGGMEELAEAALEASGRAVADALSEALDTHLMQQSASSIPRHCQGSVAGDACAGRPISPTALESPIISARLRAAAALCFERWETLITARFRADRWPED